MDRSSENPAGLSATADEPSRLFVGRERELGELRAGLEIAISGRGRLFLIAGEPGIGKTRLLGELAAHAPRRDAHVLWGRCWEGEGAPAYWPWVQIIRSYVRATDPEKLRSEMGPGAADIAQVITEVRERLPDLKDPPALEAEHARFRLFDSITGFLRNAASTRPLVLILDDLHWADKASLLLLRFLAGEMAESRILVTGAYRDVEVQRGHPFAEVLPDLRRQPVHQRILLRGLAETDVRKLVAALGAEDAPEALVKVVSRETEGNPFFIGEIVQHLVEQGSVQEDGRWTSRLSPEEMGIPESIRDVIGRRLNRLSKECNEVLAVASVIGREFTTDVLERVSDGGALQNLLQEALGARVIVETPRSRGRYSFSHALIREALYGELHTPTRLRLHRRIAEVLEEIHAHDLEPHLSPLAYHFFEAAHGTSDIAKAIDYAQRAGTRAESLLAYDEAADQYRRALELLDVGESGDQRRLDLSLALGDALRRAGDRDHACGSFQRAGTIAKKLDQPEKLARAALGYAGRWMSSGWGDDVMLRVLKEAFAALPERDSGLRASVMARLAPELFWKSSTAEFNQQAVAMTREAIDMARRCGDNAALAYALGATGMQMFEAFEPDLDKVKRGTEVGRLARSVGDNELALLGSEWRIQGLIERCEIDDASAEIETFASEAEELRQPFYVWRVSLLRGIRAIIAGRFEEGERFCHLALAQGRRVVDPSAALAQGALMFVLRWDQGRLEEMEAPLRRSVERYGPRYPSMRGYLAWLYAETGRQDEARKIFEELIANSFPETGRTLTFVLEGSLLAETCALLRDERAAVRLYDLLLPYDRGMYTGVGGTMCHGSMARRLGLLAAVLGRWDEAKRHFEHALEIHEKARARPFLARTRYEYAGMLLSRGATGDREKTRGLLKQAVEAAEELGMKTVAERAAGLLRQASDVTAAPEPSAAGTVGSQDEILRRDGDYWTIAYEGQTFRLRDTKGLQYLAHLLRHQREEFHVADLVAAVDGRNAAEGAARELTRAPGLGDAGDLLDPQARAEYKQRLEDLRAELDQATEWGDRDRASLLNEEIEFISEELSAAYGLGGRARKGADTNERIRKAVSNRIRDSIARIERESRALAEHLTDAVRMGLFCSYSPKRAGRRI